MTPEEKLLSRLALTFIPGVGNVLARRLAVYCGSPEAVFAESGKALSTIPGMSFTIRKAITARQPFDRAEEEMRFMERQNVRARFFTDPEYPERLKDAEDAPALIYIKGRSDLQNRRMVAVVGTRKATAYGRAETSRLVRDLAPAGPCIVSGLAYGIDVCAHRTALQESLETVAVVAHSLDRLYPGAHRQIADEILETGALVSEFPSGTKLDPSNFPQRNRIIAGMCDGVIVMEAGDKGGALITARLASSYHREVYAFPGRAGDQMSKGCNKLIRENIAMLAESGADILKDLRWDASGMSSQPTYLFESLDEDESAVLRLIRQNGKVPIDTIYTSGCVPAGKAGSILLNLELAGAIRSLPGKIYSPA